MVPLPLPTSWDECTNEQFVSIAIITSSAKEPFSDLVKLLFSLSGLNEDDFLVKSDFENFEKHQEALSFIKELCFEKVFVPEIKIGNRIFNSYNPAFEHIEFSRWVLAYIYANQYLRSKEESDLDKLLAVLYLSSEWNWRKHTNFFINLKDAPKELKQAAWLCYLGNLQAFRTKYPLAFEDKGKSEWVGSINSWDSLTNELTGPKFGTHEQTRYADAHDIFAHLEILAEKELQLSLT